MDIVTDLLRIHSSGEVNAVLAGVVAQARFKRYRTNRLPVNGNISTYDAPTHLRLTEDMRLAHYAFYRRTAFQISRTTIAAAFVGWRLWPHTWRRRCYHATAPPASPAGTTPALALPAATREGRGIFLAQRSL